MTGTRAPVLVPSLVAFTLAALVAPAAAQERPPLRVELVHGGERLRDRPDWQETTLGVAGGAPGLLSWAAGVSRWARFDRIDTGGDVRLWIPLASRTTALIGAEATVSPDFQPEWGSLLGVQRAFGGGWVAALRWAHRAYPAAPVELGSAAVEYYFHVWRAAYVLTLAAGEGDATGAAHSLRLSRYLGDRGSVNASASVGRELETVGDGRAILLDARSLDLWGEHPVGARFDLLYGAGLSDHETLGTRVRARLGLRARL